MTLAHSLPSAHMPVPAPAAGAGEIAPLCAWLAEVFIAPPSAPEIGAYRRGEAAAWLASLAADPDFAPGAAAMRQALAGEGSDEALAARLGTAFNRLFLGFGGRRTVVPCESAWRGNGRLYQAPAARCSISSPGPTSRSAQAASSRPTTSRSSSRSCPSCS